MIDEVTPAAAAAGEPTQEPSVVGMSVGVSTLVAVTSEQTLLRRAVLRLRNGAPAELAGCDSATIATADAEEITDFVRRAAEEGSPDDSGVDDEATRTATGLLVDAVRLLAREAVGGAATDETEGTAHSAESGVSAAVAYPAYWPDPAVQALRAALATDRWFTEPVQLIDDASAAVNALHANSAIPSHGAVAVCDFGAGGTTLSLLDAERDFAPLAVPLRHPGFSGHGIDEALRDHVLADLTATGALDEDAATASPPRLSEQCRAAKEELSVSTVAELPGFHGRAWLTRAELDEVIRRPLDGFLDAMQQALAQNGIEGPGLGAIIPIGGGANIPAVTGALAQRFGTRVTVVQRPQLAAAIGAVKRLAPHLTVAALQPISVPGQPAADARTGLSSGSAGEPAETAAAHVWPGHPGPPDLPPDDHAPATDPSATVTERFFTPSDARHEEAFPPAPQRTRRFPGTRELQARRPRLVWQPGPLSVIIGAAVAALLIGVVVVVALRKAATGDTSVPPPPPPEPPSATREYISPPPPPPLPPPAEEAPGAPEIPDEAPEAPDPTMPEIPETLTPSAPGHSPPEPVTADEPATAPGPGEISEDRHPEIPEPLLPPAPPEPMPPQAPPPHAPPPEVPPGG